MDVQRNPEGITIAFPDAVFARAQRPAIQGELEPDARLRFHMDIQKAFQNPEHPIQVIIPSARLMKVYKYLRQRTFELEPRSILSPERPLKPYDPTDIHVDHTVNAQLMTLAKLSIEHFLGTPYGQELAAAEEPKDLS